MNKREPCTRSKYNKAVDSLKYIIDEARLYQTEYEEWKVNYFNPTLWDNWLVVVNKHLPTAITIPKLHHLLQRFYIICCDDKHRNYDTSTLLRETFNFHKACKDYVYCDLDMYMECDAEDCENGKNNGYQAVRTST